MSIAGLGTERFQRFYYSGDSKRSNDIPSTEKQPAYLDSIKFGAVQTTPLIDQDLIQGLMSRLGLPRLNDSELGEFYQRYHALEGSNNKVYTSACHSLRQSFGIGNTYRNLEDFTRKTSLDTRKMFYQSLPERIQQAFIDNSVELAFTNNVREWTIQPGAVPRHAIARLISDYLSLGRVRLNDLERIYRALPESEQRSLPVQTEADGTSYFDRASAKRFSQIVMAKLLSAPPDGRNA
jgi:hypothetical protein